MSLSGQLSRVQLFSRVLPVSVLSCTPVPQQFNNRAALETDWRTGMKAAAAIQLRTGAARRLLLLLLLWSKSGSPMQTTELLHAHKDWPEKGEGGKPKQTQTAENWRSAAPLCVLCSSSSSSFSSCSSSSSGQSQGHPCRQLHANKDRPEKGNQAKPRWSLIIMQ